MDFHRHLHQRAEAERWLSTAVKLLTTRDLHGTKSFAIRARESDPRLGATDQLIAVADTLLAGESRINNQPDWYAILQLARRTNSLELVATQYRRLALLLNPQANRFPFADQAFRLVSDAWAVLSNPSTKSFYDHHLNLFDSPPPQPPPSSQLFERQFLQMHGQPLQQPLFHQQISQPQPLRPPITEYQEYQASPPQQQQLFELTEQPPLRYRNTENQPSPQRPIEHTPQPPLTRNRITRNQPSPQQQHTPQPMRPPIIENQ